MTSDQLSALARVWAERMPITAALGVVPTIGDESFLTVSMPLLPNRNHKGTVFAGSLSSLATLTGWSALWLMARDAGMNPHIVIQNATVEYRLPARSDVKAVCPMPDPATRERLLAVYKRRGRVRTTLDVSLRDARDAEVAVFSGRYVVHRLDLFVAPQGRDPVSEGWE